MQHVIKAKWNKVVCKDDLVFHLGDVAFSYSKQKLTKLISKLNGRKILIIGNHDTRHKEAWWREVGFESVYQYPIIYKGFYMLSHQPLYINDHMPYINIHGHIHSNNYDDSQHINVSVEQINYTPISFYQIEDRLGIK